MIVPWAGYSSRDGDSRLEPLRDLGGHLSFCSRSVRESLLCVMLCGVTLLGVPLLQTFPRLLQMDHVVDVAVDLHQEFNWKHVLFRCMSGERWYVVRERVE